MVTVVVAVGDGVGVALTEDIGAGDVETLGVGVAPGLQDAGAGNCAKVIAEVCDVAAMFMPSVSSRITAAKIAVDLRICVLRPIMIVTLTTSQMVIPFIQVTHSLPTNFSFSLLTLFRQIHSDCKRNGARTTGRKEWFAHLWVTTIRCA